MREYLLLPRKRCRNKDIYKSQLTSRLCPLYDGRVDRLAHPGEEEQLHGPQRRVGHPRLPQDDGQARGLEAVGSALNKVQQAQGGQAAVRTGRLGDQGCCVVIGWRYLLVAVSYPLHDVCLGVGDWVLVVPGLGSWVSTEQTEQLRRCFRATRH